MDNTSAVKVGKGRLAIAAAVVLVLVVASQFLPIREWTNPYVPPPEPPTICYFPEQKWTYSGPNSGVIVWKGIAQGSEFVAIDHNVASKGSIVSGKLPEVPVLIEPQNPKRLRILDPPELYPRGRWVRDGRAIFRIDGRGPRTVVLRWSVGGTQQEAVIDD